MRVISNAIHQPINYCIKWLQRIRPKRLYQCTAVCPANTTRCRKTTDHIYCQAHESIYREYHRLYHLYDNRSTFLQAGMRMVDILETELQLRERFNIQFQLPLDEGHRTWNEFLRSTKNRYINSSNDQDYVLLLPHYGRDTIRRWHKNNYINIETKRAYPKPVFQTSNEIFPGTKVINRTVIFKHFFDCQCNNHRPVSNQQIQALDLSVAEHIFDY